MIIQFLLLSCLLLACAFFRFCVFLSESHEAKQTSTTYSTESLSDSWGE